jgi:hypothetical protein
MASAVYSFLGVDGHASATSQGTDGRTIPVARPKKALDATFNPVVRSMAVAMSASRGFRAGAIGAGE